MKHTILGAGAIGGLLGTALASLGNDVSLIVRSEKLSRYPDTLTLERPDELLTAKVKIVAELAAPTDVLWIATKTYQLEDALGAIRVPPPAIVPLLNGIDHVAVLRSRYGDERVIPATIAVEAERLAEGRYAQRSPVRLNLAQSGEPLLGDTAQELRDIGFLCSFIASEATLLWSKLCFLGPFALATAASGKNLGEILADAEWKQTLDYAFAEARAVAEAFGAQIDPARLQAILDSSPPTMRSSMAKDLDAGRRLELDGIAGPILRGAARWGIEVPTTQRLVAMIEQRQQKMATSPR
jgi:2-dehydropantoate 2-reductase